jgi:type IV pilus assembly protein PilC
VTTFNYRAADQFGRPVKGQMDAINEVDLEIRLEQVGLALITLKPAKKTGYFFQSRKISLKDLMMFCFQMEQLTSAGVPLLDGLCDVRDNSTNAYLQKIVGTLVSDIEGGKMFSQALAEHPQVFNKIFVSLVEAAEKTGKLTEVFAHIASTYQWQDDLISQTKKLIAYPLFVLAVVISAVVFLMIYLVPQMVGFLHNMGQTLPVQTRILIFISDGFMHYWWLLVSLPVLTVSFLVASIRTSATAQYYVDYAKLNAPVIGSILQKIILARFSRYFALMYQSGIPILDAIKTCEEIVGNRVIAEALQRVQFQIAAGTSMGDSFQNAAIFPPLVVRMIRVGENTGGLDKSLLKISHFYDRDVNDSVESMLKMLEPALTVILGAILAFIMFAVLGPVYDSFSQLKI